MTERLAVTKAERFRHTETLRLMRTNFDTAADGHEKEEQMAQAELWHRRAAAIRWALGYVERHVNLLTGELTISLSELEELQGT